MIDDRLPEEWPDAVLAAAREWRQGYVVEEPPFFYYRSESEPLWEIGLADDEEAGDAALVELDPDLRSRFGLITTQTCDLYEEGRPRQPWFAVAPVYDIAARIQPAQIGQLMRGDFSYLVLLTAGWLPSGHWVADLRIEMPVEKGWLVGRDPRPGFAEIKDYDKLAARLASRRGRPALSPLLTVSLTKPLRDWLNGRGKPSRDSLESLRLRVVGDPVTSTQAELLVITRDEGMTPELEARWREWEAARLQSAETDGVLLQPFRYGTLDEFTARDIETSLRLDFDHLSPD